MLFRKIIAFAVLFLAGQTLFGEIFEFKYMKDDMYKMVTKVEEDVSWKWRGKQEPSRGSSILRRK
jgi:hypothetical protein